MSQRLDKFDRYVALYEKLIKRNAKNFVGEYLAEDVTQETFFKMFQHLDYLEDDMVRQWLLIVSSNIARDYLRKGGKFDIQPMEPEKLALKMNGSCASAEECFEKQDQQQAAVNFLQTACNILYEKNPNWYYIMVDSYMLDMTSEQIGKVLGIRAGTVDVMKTRAKAYLRKKLSESPIDFF